MYLSIVYNVLLFVYSYLYFYYYIIFFLILSIVMKISNKYKCIIYFSFMLHLASPHALAARPLSRNLCTYTSHVFVSCVIHRPPPSSPYSTYCLCLFHSCFVYLSSLPLINCVLKYIFWCIEVTKDYEKNKIILKKKNKQKKENA